ncbi:MAG: hypothetical protein SFZ24_06830 [Planctomycetota bacterium]|nr:hypothetical protein [Planctomycetota bacterium]
MTPPDAPRAATRSAHAKLNLILAVGPPRAGDGFHPICSWFTPVSLADELRVERLADGAATSLEISWSPDAPRPSPIDWPLEKDLAQRAHALLEREVGTPLPVRATLRKRVPIGGGLGGGSSDAAAMLLALRDLFGLEITTPRLARLGSRLGSDIPFFVRNALTPALVEGVGEVVTPLPALEAFAVLIIPPFGTPTGPVYAAFDRAGPAPLVRRERVESVASTGTVRDEALFNDLAAAAEAVEPRLAELRRRAAELGGSPVHITGSGSTMFALASSAAQARGLAERLSGRLPECACLPVALSAAPVSF